MNGVYDFTGDDDYKPGPYVITIPAGQTLFPFNVSLLNDDMSEENKEFNLVIATRFLIDRFIRGRINRARIIIMDDDNG